jgi:short subunit dehydrogenase-like uncharacterized protein
MSGVSDADITNYPLCKYDDTYSLSVMDALDKPVDLVVYGATGYAGRQIIRYLAARPSTPTWAIAGRRRAALEALPRRPPNVPVITAALTDPDSLRRMTSRSRVVLNLAGPYQPHAEALVAACIDTGTHYADLSGEIALSRRLQDRHDERAQAAGVAVVPSCGYESVPFDLLVAALHEWFRRDDGSRIQSVGVQANFTYRRHPLRVGLGLSGGTVATTVGFAAEQGLGQLTNPFALVAKPGDPDLNVIDLTARRDSVTGDWLSPLAPAPFVNPAVVHRTSELLGEDGYAPLFAYREAFNTTRSLTGLPGAPRLVARAFAAMVGSIVACSEGRDSRIDRLRLTALQRIGPRPGQGPREATLDMIGYRLEAQAVSDSGLRATAHLDAHGNAGYRSTPNILAEAGIALASGPKATGVVTPAAALGAEFLDRLGPAGISHSVEAAS